MQATLSAEPAAKPTDAPGRAWRRLLIPFSVAALLLWPAWQLVQIYLLGNVHEVIPGLLYRGGQPTGPSLEGLIDRYQIRTVLNVRGCCYPDPWYLAEAEVCERRGVHLEDVSFSAIHLPSRDELRLLVEALERAERPIFVHCRHGADRTGIAAMAAELLLEERSHASAHRQLSLRYGHLSVGRTGMLDRFMRLYADWLKDTGQDHSAKQFRHWALNEYRGGWCDAHFEKVERLFNVPKVGHALEYDVVVRNTGPTPWRFSPLKLAGHHVTFKVVDPMHNTVHEGRAGMFDRLVAPGETIRVVMRVPAMQKPGHYRLLVDMIEERHCWFHQTGSEPWEEELEIRE